MMAMSHDSIPQNVDRIAVRLFTTLPAATWSGSALQSLRWYGAYMYFILTIWRGHGDHESGSLRPIYSGIV